MIRELFGTDGIRGVADEFPLDARTTHAAGVALGRLAVRLHPRPQVALGIDTRESSPWLAAHVAGGLARVGVRTRFAGVLTTPGIAWLARTEDFVAGVMISASHNPYQDNCIKIFGHTGCKLPDGQEHALEQEILTLVEQAIEPEPASLETEPGLDQAYLDYLASTFGGGLDGLRIVVDCANGAASTLAPELFTRLGAEVVPIHCAPDGRNINRDCGALHLSSLRETVVARRAGLGIALDGDADRAMFVSGSGKIVDGDAVLLLAARHLYARGELAGLDGCPIVVATVMSNLGLEEALERHGIRLLRAPVGDKYVLEEMLRSGAVLGGEQSGHIIFRACSTAGDGLLTALRVLEIVRLRGKDLDELTAELVLRPQRLINVPVRVREPLEQIPEVATAIQCARDRLGDSGRVLVRFSGTEMLARVMVEGPEAGRVEEAARRIAGAIQSALGGGCG